MQQGNFSQHCTKSRAAPMAMIQCHPGVKACGTRRRQLQLSLATLLLPIFPREGGAAVGKKVSSNGDWSSPGLASKEDDAPKFFKSAQGVKVQELSKGQGRAAGDGDLLELQYVLRRTNGYFIYSTVEGVSFQPKDIPTGPFEFKLGDEGVIPGLQDAVRGMQAGGKRRALVPPELGFVNDTLQPQPPTFATKRQLLNHSKEALMFELQLLAIRSKQ